ncbi:hypothetical protein GIB67_042750 [Kingdonia uniflora]|uniref:Uncharacterized protein n=1 Tax=Kingdonia uniflora TaxID=39325 RepID=A0A7J7L0W9_9MAGN|nr:hypothetical protein GIB67_042750 [Kingdonia uniflora]
MPSIASFLVFMSGEDESSMGTSSEPLTTQRKEYRPRGLQALLGGLIPIQFDDVGQLIGPNRKFLCTFIGETTRENLSPLVGDWRHLGEEDKEYIRKVVAEKGRPKGTVKWYEIFMACHTKEDGTYPEEMKERMEYGADGNGHVRGYNGHLNKTNIRVSTLLRRVIERGRVKQAMLNEVQESLEVKANERRQLEKKVVAFESYEVGVETPQEEL